MEQETWIEKLLFRKLIGRRKTLHAGKMVLWVLLTILAITALYPVVFLIFGSFMGRDELEVYL